MQLSRPLSVITPTVDGDVLTVLARTQRFLTVGEVHRSIGRWSVNGVRNALVRLTGQGLVTTDTSRPVPLYALNREHLAAEPVIELAHLQVRLVSRLRRELAEWQEPPTYAALLEGHGDLQLLLVRPDSWPTATTAAGSWAADVEALRRAVSVWTGSEVRVLELSESELSRGLGEQLPLLVDVRRAGLVLAGDEALLWRRPDTTPPVTGQ